MRIANPYRYAMPWALVFLLMSCTGERKTDTRLGALTFEISCSPEAASHFEQGALLLHSFEFADAAEAFRSAQQADPSCAMAFWGEAMTYNHPLWAEQDFEKATEVLNRLAASSEERVKKAGTEMEQDFIRAINVLYGDGEKNKRDKEYAEFMEGLYQKYPGNHEVAAFYALSLMGSVPVGRNVELYQKSARIANSILEENPRHPGALHYLIHADDDPSHAKFALDAAREYSTVAPDAGHALHMPSHIYVALGMWDDVVASNEASWQASVNRKEEKKLDNNALNYHGFHWLLYGYLQKGRHTDAEKILSDMKLYCAQLPSSQARVHEILLKGTYLAETGDWRHPVLQSVTRDDDLNLSIRAIQSNLLGAVAFRNNRPEIVDSLFSSLAEERAKVASTLNELGIAVCSSGSSRNSASKLDVNLAEVMELQLRSMAALLAQNLKAAEKYMKDAEALESSLDYSYGPPAVPKPSAELYADFLLDHDRTLEAKTWYEVSLQRAPKRVLSLEGLLEVARQTGDSQQESLLLEQLSEIYREADPDVSKKIAMK